MRMESMPYRRARARRSMEGISILREVMITILVPILLKFMELNFTEDVKRVLGCYY